MKIEYFGELLADGHLSVDPDVLSKLNKGVKLKITIEPLPTNISINPPIKKEYDLATRRLLEKMRTGNPIGAPEDPRLLSHKNLMAERLEEKLSWKD